MEGPLDGAGNNGGKGVGKLYCGARPIGGREEVDTSQQTTEKSDRMVETAMIVIKCGFCHMVNDTVTTIYGCIINVKLTLVDKQRIPNIYINFRDCNKRTHNLEMAGKPSAMAKSPGIEPVSFFGALNIHDG